MSVLPDMCDIVRENADERLRYFARGDPETGAIEVLHCRDDLEWTERRRHEVDAELQEVLARDSYEHMMDADNVNQIIKVADTKVLFTGFIEGEVAVAAFERGVLPVLPDIVAEFREYMEANDVAFISLEM